MTERPSLREVRDNAAQDVIRDFLKNRGKIPQAAIALQTHENTIRHWMKRAGITPEQVDQWANERLRQRAIQFNGSK